MLLLLPHACHDGAMLRLLIFFFFFFIAFADACCHYFAGELRPAHARFSSLLLSRFITIALLLMLRFAYVDMLICC